MPSSADEIVQAHPSSSRPTPATVIGVGLLIASVAATAIYGGHSLKSAREQRAAAIALTGGDPERGRELVKAHGCAGCHTIPGVAGANGLVGPSLGDLSRRVYIAGVLTNTPDNLVRWIENPRAVDPRTAMPATGITRAEATDVAAFLYAGPSSGLAGFLMSVVDGR